jgi:NAD-dependent SIR2 family protein deacetylase
VDAVFDPIASAPASGGLRELVAEVADLVAGGCVAALTGAGCSTESGIPDYRGGGTSRRARNPIQYRQFLDKPEHRRRYWARSCLGWRRMSQVEPNPGHRALARMEESGALRGIITQNVDGLHQAAGSRRVVELHGNLGGVRCLDCEARQSRTELQQRLEAMNPGWSGLSASPAPDGDSDLEHPQIEGFRVPGCRACGGRLKPEVVFFGENVAPAVVESAYGLLERSDALLVAGTSLAVFSGYRFVRRAAERGLPIVILNQGPTRGDEFADLQIGERLGLVLPALAGMLATPEDDGSPRGSS